MAPTSLSSQAPWHARWRSLSGATVRGFHTYATWLVSISWKRFTVLSILLLIVAGVLSDLPPFSWTVRETVIQEPRRHVRVPQPPQSPQAPQAPQPPSDGSKQRGITIETPDKHGDDELQITIGENGVNVVRKPRASASAASAASAAASAASAADIASSAIEGLRIDVPKGADPEVVREAVETAREDIRRAIEDARRDAENARRDAEQARREAAEAAADAAREAAEDDEPRTHIRRVKIGEFLPQLATLWILGSILIKATYKGRMQAEVKAAQATETAESEQLKRQVIEARMAAMQAQVEPHFLFNTLASIDHLIETDPPRASKMQKNLIALLRASMPSLRETNTTGTRGLGRELAMVRPYLEILKVRMEERLQVDIQVPDGLDSAEFPPMMLQSLVENAIKHGLEPKAEGGTLTVKAEIQHGKLAVTVADTGLGFGKAATSGTGTGLVNIRERLSLLYGNQANLTITENQPSGTRIVLTLPYRISGDAPTQAAA